MSELVVVCSEPPHLAIVSEFIEEGSLDHIWHRLNLDLLSYTQMARGIASGMKFLHEMQIIHRDLACRNILVKRDEKNDCYIPKITDFGMSRLVKSDFGMTLHNVGPLKWWAPEALDCMYVKATDVWSYGVALIELWTKNDPYPGETPVSVGFKVRDGDYHCKIPDSMPPLLSEILLDCWKYKPEARPTFEELLRRLDKLYFSVKWQKMQNNSPNTSLNATTSAPNPASAAPQPPKSLELTFQPPAASKPPPPISVQVQSSSPHLYSWVDVVQKPAAATEKEARRSLDLSAKRSTSARPSKALPDRPNASPSKSERLEAKPEKQENELVASSSAPVSGKLEGAEKEKGRSEKLEKSSKPKDGIERKEKRVSSSSEKTPEKLEKSDSADKQEKSEKEKTEKLEKSSKPRESFDRREKRVSSPSVPPSERLEGADKAETLEKEKTEKEKAEKLDKEKTEKLEKEKAEKLEREKAEKIEKEKLEKEKAEKPEKLEKSTKPMKPEKLDRAQKSDKPEGPSAPAEKSDSAEKGEPNIKGKTGKRTSDKPLDSNEASGGTKLQVSEPREDKRASSPGKLAITIDQREPEKPSVTTGSRADLYATKGSTLQVPAAGKLDSKELSSKSSSPLNPRKQPEGKAT